MDQQFAAYSLCTETYAFRRSKRHGMMMSVTERYIRDDIPCGLDTCTQCLYNNKQLRSDLPILVPDHAVLSRYVELLEEGQQICNLVICQSVLDALDHRNRTRTIRNLRRLALDPRRHSLIFANTVFRPTYQAQNDIAGVAQWYSQHAGSSMQVIVLTLSKSTQYDNALTQCFEEYIEQCHPFLLPHYQSITSATEGGDMDITQTTMAQYASNKLKAQNSDEAGNFAQYLSAAELEEGIKRGELVRGKIKVLRSGNASLEAKAVIDRSAEGKPTIEVVGKAAINRACSGDTVVARILKSSIVNKAPQVDVNDEEDIEEDISETLEAESIDAGEDASIENPEEESMVYGTVVGVMERKWRPFVATLQVDDIKRGGARHLAIPVDSAVPKIRIHYMDTAEIADMYFVVAIDSWPSDSQYPQGHFVRTLGPIGNLDTEIDVILVERQIAVSQSALSFSARSLREMPLHDTPAHPWVPSDEEVGKRRDLRESELIFSIDPKGSQDIDDAVSMRVNDKGDGYVMGVHIADVAQFVVLGSATDIEAQARGTTVYLADRRFNMIPEVLSEQICSLRGNKDRYAVSVMWDLDEKFNATNVWFGRTLIRSACEMYYEQAQAMLDGKSKIDGLDPQLEPRLREGVLLLARAMRVLRRRRLDQGALELASTEVKFTFDEKTRSIKELVPKASLEIHRVIEEAMVFSNSAVARRIHQFFPQTALLRRHGSPSRERFSRLIEAARIKGFEVGCESNAALSKSLKLMTEKGDPDMVFLAKSMATLAMQEAEYMPTGYMDTFGHYGLALGFYTHFTSPIRRYADIVVHRQLLAAISEDNEVYEKQWVKGVAERLNERNRQSKQAQRESTELFQSRYVMQHSDRELVADGVIAEIRTHGFIVYVPKLGLRGPVNLQDSKSGDIKLPLSVITGNRRDVDKLVEGCSQFTADAQKLSLRLPMDVPVFHLKSETLNFAIFDHVRVALCVLATRRRRPPVFMKLMGRPMEKAYRSTLPSLDKVFRISASSMKQQDKKDDADVEEGVGVDTSVVEPQAQALPRKKKKAKVDLYAVITKFQELSVLETQWPQ